MHETISVHVPVAPCCRNLFNPIKNSRFALAKPYRLILMKSAANSPMPRPIVEQTADGSATLYLAELDEHYHSVKGALTEAQHVYIHCALHHRMHAEAAANPLRVLEVGFGTGLNAALTAMQATPQHPLHYFGIEKYPLAPSLITHLGYEQHIPASLLQQLHQAPWDTPVALSPHFCLQKLQADVLCHNLPDELDVVYFDAFAPEKQPEMWSEAMFRKLYSAMRCHGVLTTYCAKGSIRRLLQMVGFQVERLAGPPGGKREILRATKPA